MIEIPVLLFEIGIDIPRVPLLGFVDEGLQKITANGILRPSSIGFRWSESFGVAALVEQAGHAASLRIDLYADKFVLQRVGGSFQHEVIGYGFRCCANEIGLVADCGRVRQEEKMWAMSCRIDGEKLRLRRFALGIV